MLYLSPYEIGIIIIVFLAITVGPPIAGLVLAFVRRVRSGDGGPPG